MTPSKKQKPAEDSAEGTSGESLGTFDERLESLERIAAGLEGGELGLEQALKQYKQGIGLLRSCRKELEGVRAQVQELSSEPGGDDRPFDGDPDA